MKAIEIVHIADLHADDSRLLEFQKRAVAFLRDIERNGVKPDFLVVSGDIAYSGQPNQYEIVNKYLFEPFCRQFDVSRERIVMAMGNHDVQRRGVEKHFSAGVLSALCANGENDEVLRNGAAFAKQEEGYLGFLNTLYECKDPTYTRMVSIDGIDIGFASLNTARTCFANDDTEHKIFLSDLEVNSAAREIEKCGIKIVVMHHPLTWLHESQHKVVIPDIIRNFDLILTGHLHEVDSCVISKPDSKYILVSAPPFFEGGHREGGPVDGYNYYIIDSVEKKCKVHFRKYVRARDKYVQNVDFADDGSFVCDMPDGSFLSQPSYPTVALVRKVSNSLASDIDEHLRQVQKVDHPIYIAPTLCSVTIDSSGTRMRKRLKEGEEKFSHINFFFAPSDVGSTLYFKRCCQDRSKTGQIAFYLDAQQIGRIVKKEQILKYISQKYDIDKASIVLEGAEIYIDNVGRSAQEVAMLCRQWFSDEVTVHICVKDDVTFEALCRGNTNKDTLFYEFRYWGPAKLKEFIIKFAREAGLEIKNLEVVTDFVINSLSLSDIPITPYLVAIYLRVFCECNGALGSLPISELLEQVEARSFSQTLGTGINSRYWGRKFLSRLANECYKSRDLLIPAEKFKHDFTESLRKMGLEGNFEALERSLIDSGVIVYGVDGRLGFSCYTFFRYYLSFSFDEGSMDLNTMLLNIQDATSIGDAAAYYVARFRNRADVSLKLLDVIAQRFEGNDPVTLDGFEKYAKGLLAPVETSAADKVAKDLSSQKVSEEKEEEIFSEHKNSARREETENFQKKDVANDTLADISQNISLLKMTYHVFRNLEALPIEEKMTILDRILRFHLNCNMQLVKFFNDVTGNKEAVSSLFAYMITLGGTGFLSYNVGSWSLKRAIREMYKRETDELRRFLLVCIKADIGMEEYTMDLVSIMTSTKSLAIVEMGYFKFKECIVRYKGERIPNELIAAFNTIYRVRNSIARYAKSIDVPSGFNREMSLLRRAHLEYVQDKIAGREV